MKYIKQDNLKEDLFFFTFNTSYLTISLLDLQKDPIYEDKCYDDCMLWWERKTSSKKIPTG